MVTRWRANGVEGRLGVELPEDRHPLADVQRAEIEALAAPVMHARRNEVHPRQRLEPEGVPERFGAIGGHRRVHGTRARPDHRFGLTCRARRVVDGEAQYAVRRLRRWLAVDQLPFAREAGDVAPNRDAQRDRPGPRKLVRPFREVVVQDHGHRSRVIHNLPDLGARERRIQCDGGEPALLRRQLPPQHVDVVRQRVGESVSGNQPPRPQPVHELVGATRQLRKGQRHARRARHDRRLIREFLGEIPKSQPPIPRVSHGE